MRRRTGIMAIILVLVVMGGLITAIMIPYERDKDVVVSRAYAGRLYLEEDKYEEFKQYLADNPEIRINKLDVLASPNALVDMELVAPADMEVPYGEVAWVAYKATQWGLSTPLALISLFSAIVLIVVVNTTRWRENGSRG